MLHVRILHQNLAVIVLSFLGCIDRLLKCDLGADLHNFRGRLIFSIYGAHWRTKVGFVCLNYVNYNFDLYLGVLSFPISSVIPHKALLLHFC